MNFGPNGSGQFWTSSSGPFPIPNALQSLFHQAITFWTIHVAEVYGVATGPRNLPLSGGTEQWHELNDGRSRTAVAMPALSLKSSLHNLADIRNIYMHALRRRDWYYKRIQEI